MLNTSLFSESSGTSSTLPQPRSGSAGEALGVPARCKARQSELSKTRGLGKRGPLQLAESTLAFGIERAELEFGGQRAGSG